MSSLFVMKGPDRGRRFDLKPGANSLGRETTNSIQLADDEVSRRHAEIHVNPTGVELFDLGSANGTRVNEQLIERAVLRNGDHVELGRSVLLFTRTAPSHLGTGSGPATERTRVPRALLLDTAGDSRVVRSISAEEQSRIVTRPVDVSAAPWLGRARADLDILYRTAMAISHMMDIDQLLQRILDFIFEWVDCDRGCIMLLDASDELVVRAGRSQLPNKGEETFRISRTIVDYVMKDKQGIMTSDARRDERFQSGQSILQLGVREAICVPMQGRYGIVGLIYIDTYVPPGRVVGGASRSFVEDHLKLMVAIGHQAALAVEDTSYYSALVQSERLAAMGQTIATLSHHIKNILQGIRGGGYLIEQGLKTENLDVIGKGWAIVERNQERISQLVLDMLSFSKEREPEPVLSDIQELLADVAELMMARAADQGVELVVVPRSDLPQVMFDPEAMHRAVLNVVTNAIDACGDVENGQVTIEASFEEDTRTVTIAVTDTGSGIEPADLTKIFTVFESRKGNRGTGLGLPVSQKILREHGGEITVDSTVGRGSCFSLRFPARFPDDEPPTDLGSTRVDDPS